MENTQAHQKEVYTLVYAFREETALARHVTEAQKVLKEGGVQGSPAKIGTHLTIFPPFYATKDVAKTYATLIQVGELIRKEFSDAISGLRIGWFPAPTSDSVLETIHLKVKLWPEYIHFISRIKASDTFEWIHPHTQTTPVEPVYIPHIHLLEGAGLIACTQQYEDKLNLFFENKHYPLGEIRLFRKRETENSGISTTKTFWQQVLV